MELPRNYNRTLQRTHPRVRLRWSDARECWLVEQQIGRAKLPLPYKGIHPDTARCLNDGYREIGRYPARELPPVDRLVRYLNCMSPERWKSGDELADHLDMVDSLATDRKNARIRRHFNDRSADAYDDFARAEGSRSFARSNAARAV